MKKIAVLLMVLAFVVSVCMVVPSAASTNVAAGKTYTYTGQYKDNGVYKYPDNDTKTKLTDGEVADVSVLGFSSTLWIGMNWLGDGANNGGAVVGGPAPTSASNKIVIDLGEVTSDLTKFSINTEEVGGAGIKIPKSVKVSISDTNGNFKNLGTAKKNLVEAKPGANATTDKDNGIYEFSLILSEATSGRYVCFTIDHSTAWVFISEAQVIKGDPGSDPTEESSEATVSNESSQTSSAAVSDTSSTATSSTTNSTVSGNESESQNPDNNTTLYIVIGVVAVVVIGAVLFFSLKKKK